MNRDRRGILRGQKISSASRRKVARYIFPEIFPIHSYHDYLRGNKAVPITPCNKLGR